MRKALLILITSLSGTISVSANQSSVNPSANAQLGARRAAEQSNPFRKLFETRETLTRAVEQATQIAAPAPTKKVACGMTVIEVGSELDPKMGVTPPKDGKVTYTIRAVEPPICNK